MPLPKFSASCGLLVAWIATVLLAATGGPATAAETAPIWLAGFSKVDITPTEPVRLAGYGSRDRPSEGVDTPLHVRCAAIRQAGRDSEPAILLSVDTIGLPGDLTKALTESVRQKHGLPRERIVLCSTHTHCGPDLVSELSNIFSTPLSEEEQAAGLRYKQQLRDGVLEAVDSAIADFAPAKLAHAAGEVGFAANRRVLTDGRWSGFGVQPEGPIDHSVPVLRVTAPDGKLRGLLFNYACHCTTLGGDHNRINAEWAGYATTGLEAKYPGSVALCTIGCGADANPEPRGTLDAAKIHGRTLAAEVQRVAESRMQPITEPLQASFDYAALSFDLPTPEQLKSRLQAADSQTRRHAQQLLDTYQQKGRLPATYPVPIQGWRFGNQLTMVFIGGEVVVDYALRLKETLGNDDLWVTAYANDVLGYIASERMRAEGGYEYDRSGVFYGLPGPWASGTEDKLIGEIETLLQSTGRSRPLPTDEALRSFQLSDPSLKIELVAAEPLVQDPINLAFGPDGRLWVVEMGDYPSGDSGGGRIKCLSDTNDDGVFDTATAFLSGLSFPTGVHPWGDGVIIAAAPDILWAQDTTGDGKADHTEVLYTGFRLSNPQHRVNGFTYGLDHSLHCAAGDNLGEITCRRSGETVDASGCDVKLWPDSGKLAVVSGRSQYIRSRNDWGSWFGNNNSLPMFHYVVDTAYLKRNDAVGYSDNVQQLFDPPVAPPVFPATRSNERFNDLFAAGRFTSACGTTLFRSPQLGPECRGAAFVCEPVHNLVHRSALVADGATFKAQRIASEQDREFLTSTDPWFRPTRAMTGTDGMLWVVDMYRETIEHPEWIPEAWQQQLNLWAGSDRGRIYRISPRDAQPRLPSSLHQQSTAQLQKSLAHPVGPVRDLAQQQLIEQAAKDDESLKNRLQEIATDSPSPYARVHSIAVLDVIGKLDLALLTDVLQHEQHSGVLLVALPRCESLLSEHSEFLPALQRLVDHPDSAVVMQTALTLGKSPNPAAGDLLARIACRSDLDRWTARAVSSSATHHAATIARDLITRLSTGQAADRQAAAQLLTDLLVTAQANGENLSEPFQQLFLSDRFDVQRRLKLASAYVEAVRANSDALVTASELLQPVYSEALQTLDDHTNSTETRRDALALLGLGLGSAEEERERLLGLVDPSTPAELQKQAVEILVRFSAEAVGEPLLNKWPSLSQSIREHCVSLFLTKQSFSEQLLAALENGKLVPRDVSASARQQLRQSGSQAMKVRAERLLRSTGSQEKQILIRTYLRQFDTTSDLERGKQLFAKHCAACHLPDEQGRATGPSLNNLSDRTDRTLVEAILDPNQAVEPAFQSYIVQSKDDRILAGVIEEEVGDTITLAHADGKRTTMRRRDIRAIKSTGLSLMPEGFEETLAPDAVQAIVRYVQSGVDPSLARSQ